MPAHVLVIDDHAFQRRHLARRLNGLGVPSVLEAADRGEALELIRLERESLALIVSDIGIPERDRTEFLSRLAAEARRTPVCILGALDRPLRESAEVMAREHGLHLIGVLEQPATDDALRAMLVRALSSKAPA